MKQYTTSSVPVSTSLITTTRQVSSLRDFTTADFTGSGKCAKCHSNLKDARGNDVSIDTDWRSTMMANAATDPYWQAKVASEVAANPALKEIIEDDCAICHMPMARTQALVDNKKTNILDDGFLNPTNSLHEAAMDGNSCTVCHQFQASGLGEAGTFSGKFVVDTTSNPPDREIFGPFLGVLTGPMQTEVGFTPKQGKHVGTAGMCAVCHMLYTPYVDGSGKVVGTFPEQTTFLEWSNSVFGVTPGQQLECQSCHMPSAAGNVIISNDPAGLLGRSPFAQHNYVGGNTMILSILKNNLDDLGVSASVEQMNATFKRTLDQLQTRAGQITV
ncbi:MAG: hypothetical protein FJ015_06950, partial [Chloroflexi bacterium]|nr:hypothetical protein [Chloroflexota bacterium]